ncbi:TPA: phage tail protein [Aeromonas dhakensis]|nr:phage tail protein [Aeromonas dhakensis]
MNEELPGILTDLGAQLIEQAYQNGRTVVLTTMGIGDGGGNDVDINTTAITALVGEFHRQPLDGGAVGEAATGGSINYIPKPEHAGKWLREMGLYDNEGNLIVYSKTVLAQVPEVPNMAVQFLISLMVPVMNTSAVEVMVNPNGTVTQEEFDKHEHSLTLDGDVTGTATLGPESVTMSVQVKDGSHNHTIENVDGLTQALDGKASSSHTHSLTLEGDVTGTATLGPESVTMSVQVKDDSHNHTIENVDGLTQALDGKASSTHTHPPSEVGAVMSLAGSGNGGSTVTVNVKGKTLGVVYIRNWDRFYPVSFAVAAATKYGVNIINRGGENADKDYDPMLTASRDGDSLTLTKNWACQGIGDVYLM